MASKIATREKRKALKPSGKPYFETYERGVDLGFRKGQRGGVWVLRRYLGREEGYKVETIGRADDDASEAGALSYEAARELVRARIHASAEEAKLASAGPVITVKNAVEDYLARREAVETAQHGAGGRGLKRDARSRLGKHVLADDKLASKSLASLTTSDLANWRDGLELKASSARRTSNDLKAALNETARRRRAQLPPTLRDVIKDGLAAVNASAPVAREAQVLTDADVRAVITAAWEIDAEGGWDGDLARMVLVLAASGSRFSQVIRMTVADVQHAQKRLMVPTSRKGRGVKHKTHTGVRVGDDVLAALAKATAGRKGHEPLFLRPNWKQVGPAKWEKGERAPWFSSAELTRPWAKIVQRAGLPAAKVPYSLRHSAIVRGLRAGLPTRLVAALADTSSQMVERHYAAYIVDALDDLAARAIVPLTTESADVVTLRAVS